MSPNGSPNTALARLLALARSGVGTLRELLRSGPRFFPAKPGLPWLYTVGGEIYAENGPRVILRGANVMRAEWWAPDASWVPTKAIPELCKTWKGNVIVRGFASDPVTDLTYISTGTGATVTSAQYLAWLDAERQAAEDNGAYIAFVWRSHQVNAAQPPMPDAKAQQALAALAQRYHGRPNVLYGLQVEPHDTEWSTLLPIYDGMVTAIRAAAAPHRPLVLVPGTNWSRDTHWAVQAPVTADGGVNIVYKSHPYDAPAAFADDFLHAHNANRPVFLGEFGVDQGVTQQDVDALLAVTKQHGISWAAWVFDSDGPSTLLAQRTTMTPTTPYGVAVKNAMPS